MEGLGFGFPTQLVPVHRRHIMSARFPAQTDRNGRTSSLRASGQGYAPPRAIPRIKNLQSKIENLPSAPPDWVLEKGEPSNMNVTVNGEKREFDAPLTIAELLGVLGLGEQMVLVEQNLEVIPRNEMGTVKISDGDAIEVLRLAGGG